MKRFGAMLMAVLLVISTTALAYGGLTRVEYDLFYELSDVLAYDWESAYDDLIDMLAEEYGWDPDELFEFIDYAAASDADHVWFPVQGGRKYHSDPTCSKMVEPRPTTKDLAIEFGFTPCKRCTPGW